MRGDNLATTSYLYHSLGLSGYALDMVHTLQFEARGENTLVRADVRGAGELEPSWASTVQGVWHHFLGLGKPHPEYHSGNEAN